MSRTATGIVESKEWNQVEYAPVEGASGLAAATGHDRYTGDIEGEARWHGLIHGIPDGTGTFVSLQRMECTIGELSGSFVLEMTGTFDGAGSRADWVVVPGSGTADFATISGKGGYTATDATTASYSLTYTV